MSRRQSGRRRPREERALYAVLVQTWDHHYGWSVVGRSRFTDAGYNHTERLTFEGVVIYPEAFKYPRANVALYASERHKEEERSGELSTSIGTLDVVGDHLRVWAWVPSDHMAQLTAVAASGRTRIVQFYGTQLKWRRGTISNIEVTSENEWNEDNTSEGPARTAIEASPFGSKATGP